MQFSLSSSSLICTWFCGVVFRYFALLVYDCPPLWLFLAFFSGFFFSLFFVCFCFAFCFLSQTPRKHQYCLIILSRSLSLSLYFSNKNISSFVFAFVKFHYLEAHIPKLTQNNCFLFTNTNSYKFSCRNWEHKTMKKIYYIF